MNINELRGVSIVDFLEGLGYTPEWRRGTSLMYVSPLRNENTPSFHVSADKNLWYDFGLSVGGDLLKFCLLFFNVDTYSSLSDVLKNRKLSVAQSMYDITSKQEKNKQSFQMFTVSPIEDFRLIQYGRHRGIDHDIITHECRQANYQTNGKPYCAIAFENDKHGFELRNAFFKGAKSPKDISLRRRLEHDRLVVLEGFMDYLSLLQLERLAVISPGADCLILNSVSMVERAIPLMNPYPQLELMMDNDSAGRDATNHIILRTQQSSPMRVIRDRSLLYSDYKDLNDYLLKVRNSR